MNDFFLSLVKTAHNWQPLNKEEEKEFEIFDGDLLDRWNLTTKQLHKAKLTIPEEHAIGLKNNQEYYIELYNSFDIWLKELYKMNVIDFVDYETGEVYLIKGKKTGV